MRIHWATHLLLASCALAGAARTSGAATLTVPGQFPTLEAAIVAASAGDTILVSGGTYAPVTIDKPLTIIGSPVATIDNTTTPFSAPSVPPAIRLAGSGSGVVRLVGLQTRGQTDGGANFSVTASGIFGDGFDELVVDGCDIESAEWFQLTGSAFGAPAIQTGVPLVRIIRSTLRGGKSDTDVCDAGSGPSGAEGLLAPASTAVVIDSQIQGGAGADMCFFGPCPGPCPCPIGAEGGPGVVVDRLFIGGVLTAIQGGAGRPVFCGTVQVGTQPDGDPVVANTVIEFPSSIAASGPLVVGQPTTLIWQPFAIPVVLLFSTPAAAPSPLLGGWLMVAPNGLLAFTVLFSNVLSAQVPNSAQLVGAELACQVYHPALPLSAPYYSVIQP